MQWKKNCHKFIKIALDTKGKTMNDKIAFMAKCISLAIFCNASAINSIIMEDAMIEIKPIKFDQVGIVKRIIIESAFELWKTKPTIQDFEQELNTAGEFDDLDNVQEVYLNEGGAFFVLLVNEKIIGSGAIKRLTDEICELKRMWFLKEYRGKGLGLFLATELLAFAKEQGYKKVRLDVYYPEIQIAAVSLYRKLGFYEIAPYNNMPAKLFMEKIL